MADTERSAGIASAMQWTAMVPLPGGSVAISGRAPFVAVLNAADAPDIRPLDGSWLWRGVLDSW